MSTGREGASPRRLFFALWPDGAALLQFELLQRSLVAGKARRTPASNLHLTLLFAGACDERACADLCRLGDSLRVPDFDLEFSQARLVRRGGVLWSAPEQIPAALVTLAARLRTGAQTVGIVVERRRFGAHVTLARDAMQRPPQSHEPVLWPVRGFGLYESLLRPGGARYQALAHWPTSGP